MLIGLKPEQKLIERLKSFLISISYLEILFLQKM